MKGVDLQRFTPMKIYAVGARTRSVIENHHLKVTFIPDQYSSKTLGRHFAAKIVRDQKFLFPQGNLGREELTEILKEKGASIDTVEVYKNVEPDESSAAPLWDLLVREPVDVVTFASPSAAKRFAQLIPAERMRQLKHQTKVAVIGPTTEREVRELGFAPEIVATESTVQGLVRAISEYWRSQE
jgi:uroporphyrinogen-III synthase